MSRGPQENYYSPPRVHASAGSGAEAAAPAASSRFAQRCLAVTVLGLLAGIGVALPVLHLLPVSTRGLATARRLGIVSTTIRYGYADNMEATYYAAGMALVLLVACGLWVAWAVLFGGARGRDISLTAPNRARRASAEPARLTRLGQLFAWVAFPLLLVLLTFRWEYFLVERGQWGFFAEEGFQLGWVNAMLHGRTLYRDVYCFNGPLMIYPAVWFLRALGETLETMRAYVYLLNVAGIVITYYCLLRVVRHRGTAYAAGAALVVVFMPHWQHMDALSTRFFLGMLPIFACAVFVHTRRTRLLYATGLLIGVCAFFSPEMGFSAAVAVAAMAIASKFQLGLAWPAAARKWGRAAAAAALVAIAVCVPLWRQGALGSFAQIMYSYPRYTMLGFAALPFPSLPAAYASFLAGRIPAAALGTAAVAYLPPLLYAVFAGVLAIKWLRGRFTWRDSLLAGVTIYGGVLFRAALARSDPGHSYTQPILVLCALGGEGLVGAARAAWRSAARGLAVAYAVAAATLLGSLAAQAYVSNYASLAAFARATADRAAALAGRPSRIERLRAAGYLPLGLPRAPHALVPPAWYREIRSLAQLVDEHVGPDEPIFVYPNSSLLYFLLDRPNVTRYAMTYYAITTKDRRQMLQQLRHDSPSCVIVHLRTAGPENISDEDRTPAVRRHLQTAYRTVAGGHGALGPYTRVLARR